MTWAHWTSCLIFLLFSSKLPNDVKPSKPAHVPTPLTLRHLRSKYPNDEILAVRGSNDSSAFVASQAFARCRLLKPREHEASIITIESFGGHRRLHPKALTDCGKVPFAQVCRSLAVKWARYQIRVNCINMRYLSDSKRRDLNSPSVDEFPELDSAVVWLASPASKWVSGGQFNLQEHYDPSYIGDTNVVSHSSGLYMRRSNLLGKGLISS